MLLGRGNKNDYVSQSQQIIWKALGAKSAGLALNPPHCPRQRTETLQGPMLPFPGHSGAGSGLCPPGKPQRRGMLRPGPAPLGGDTASARAGAAIAPRDAAGSGTLPSPTPPRQITVSADRQGMSFSPWKKKLCLVVVVAVLQLAGAPTRSHGAARAGAPGTPRVGNLGRGGSIC